MSVVDLWSRFDDRLERWGERFHPIVVKETRQAIQSWSFPLSFGAMLIYCVLTSVALLLSWGETLQRGELGPEFFAWYVAGLLGAICFVVPLGLLRNVCAEFDGQTFELLALSSLSPRQIVFGKLKSAVVQMGAYYAAAAPFLCFTYLLQGISLAAIAIGLIIAFLAGISSCLGGLMFGALAKQSAWQVPCMVLSIGVSTIVYGCALWAIYGVVKENELAGGLGTLCAGSGCFGYVFLFYSLMTLGVSMAQFTPTVPRPGPIEVRHPRQIRSAERQSVQTGANPSETDGPEST